MSDFVYNISKGAVAEKIRDGANLGIMLLKAADADATAKDFDTITALLAGTADEADFTNYVRKTVSNGSVTLTVDDTNDRVDLDIPDQTWTAAGNSATAAGSGAGNNVLTDVVIYEDTGADGTRVPLTQHDFGPSTDGSDLVMQVAAAGFFRAS